MGVYIDEITDEITDSPGYQPSILHQLNQKGAEYTV